MSGFDFGNRLNWNLVTRLDLEAIKVGEIVGRIPARTVSLDRRIVMVGCQSRMAKVKWWLGCRASQRLLISPSSTSNFPALSHTKQFDCPLNTLTKIEFDPGGPYPYLLLLDIPHYFKHMYLEVWKYDGPDDLEPTT